MKMIRESILLTTLLVQSVVSGCGTEAPKGGGEPAAQAEPAATLKILRPPTALLSDGFNITLELAISNDEIAQGLMFRSSLGADRGMLFLLRQERAPNFWMKNTLIPLDIIFLDRGGVVVDVTHDARPCKAEPCPQYVSKAPAVAVLEVPAGTARAHGIEAGAMIEFIDVPDYPTQRD